MRPRTRPKHTLPFAAALLSCATTLVSACVVEAPAQSGAAREAATAVAPSPTAGRVPTPARPLAPVAIALAPVDAAATTDAEDGAGHVARPVAPVAIDVTASGAWPARALDPVLHVGPLHFHRYRYLDPDTLRFVVADRATLPVGADPYVQYGPDEASRIVMAHGWVPR